MIFIPFKFFMSFFRELDWDIPDNARTRSTSPP